MKRRRITRALLCAVALFACILLNGCDGYNAIMIQHLSEESNYYDLEVEVLSISIYGKDGYRKIEDPVELQNIAAPEWLDLELSLAEGSDYFQIHTENFKLLAEKGFFKHLRLGDTLVIRTSLWIYMDGNFNYIAAVRLHGVEYLAFREGLANIREMMQCNQSLL